MHMRHALHMFGKQRSRVLRAAVPGVSGVEQQEHLGRVGQRQQALNVLRRFDVGAHVVVVGQLDAVALQQVRAKGVQARRVGLPLCIVLKTRAPGDWRIDQALDGAGAFAIDHDCHAVVLQLGHVRLAALDFRRHGIGIRLPGRDFSKKSRIPARHTGQAELAELGFKRRAVLGKLVAQLKTFVADFLAFAQRSLQRRVAAQ